jgi:hypothetical protein
MGMQYDIKATKPLTSTGSFVDQNDSNMTRTRIKAIYAVCGSSAGSVTITNGNGGETLFVMNTPAVANCGYIYIILPGEGILAGSALYGTVSNTASTIVFYG